MCKLSLATCSTTVIAGEMHQPALLRYRGHAARRNQAGAFCARFVKPRPTDAVTQKKPTTKPRVGYLPRLFPDHLSVPAGQLWQSKSFDKRLAHGQRQRVVRWSLVAQVGGSQRPFTGFAALAWHQCSPFVKHLINSGVSDECSDY